MTTHVEVGRVTEEKIREVLRDFGVTEKEAEIYLFMAKHGVLRGGEISRRSKTHKALIYRILANLQKKGLVTLTLEAPVRFMAVNFETVIDLNIKAKREEAALLENAKKELLGYWKNISETASEQALEKFAVIEGSHKIYPKISQMIKECREQFDVVTSVPSLTRADQYGVLETAFHHPSRSKIQFRFLTELNEENMSTFKSLLKKTPRKGFNFKGRNPHLGMSLFPRMVIRDSEEILFFMTSTDSKKRDKEDEVCLWTNSKALVQAFKAMFDDLWSNATDIMAKLAIMDSGRLTPKAYTIADPEIAKSKYDAALNSAKEEFAIMTSSKGLTAFAQNSTILKQLTKKGVVVKIIAPIVNENLEAAEQLGKFCEVRHASVSYLGTVIIDGKQLFQFKNDDVDQEAAGAWPNFENTYYADDPRLVRRISTLLNNIWGNASILSPVTLGSFLVSSVNTISILGSDRGQSAYVSGKATSDRKDFAGVSPKQMITSRRTTGHALIHPPSAFNMPDIVIEAHHYQKESAFGESNTLDVYLKLETPRGREFVMVAVLETNPHPELLLTYKKVYAGTPAEQNIQIIKPEQLQGRLNGKNFFAGWTVPIPLPPTSKSLPPAFVLFEGYGAIKNRTYTWPFPSGFKAMIDWTGFEDAFVTFLDPTWKYAGPGTQGMIGTDVAVTAIPPIDK